MTDQTKQDLSQRLTDTFAASEKLEEELPAKLQLLNAMVRYESTRALIEGDQRGLSVGEKATTALYDKDTDWLDAEVLSFFIERIAKKHYGEDYEWKLKKAHKDMTAFWEDEDKPISEL